MRPPLPPLGRPASVLLVVYGFSLVFVSAEDAANAAEARANTLTERWTDEALLSLPPKGLLLLQTDAAFLRLEAARALGGSRPDLLVVPTSALSQRSVRLDLVEDADRFGGRAKALVRVERSGCVRM